MLNSSKHDDTRLACEHKNTNYFRLFYFAMILKVPFKLIVCGPSGCGKTQLLKDIIKNKRFDKRITQLVYCYSKYTADHNLFDEIKKSLPDVLCSFIEGFPADQIEENTLFTVSKEDHKMLILDDLWEDCLKTDAIGNLFTCYSRHLNISVAVVCQNLYITQSKYSITTLLRNVNYLVLFVCRQNYSTLRMIANNFFVTEKYRLIEPFNKFVKQKLKNDYLVVDFASREPLQSVIYMGLSDEDPIGKVFAFSSDD